MINSENKISLFQDFMVFTNSTLKDRELIGILYKKINSSRMMN